MHTDSTTAPELALIHDYVTRGAERAPDHVAFEFLDELLSYAALGARSNALANCLLALGVRRGDRVGIFMPKSIHTPVALFGIMKAGAAYVPLDPSASVERVEHLIQDCDIRCLITSDTQRRSLSKLSRRETGLTTLIGVDTTYGAWQSVGWSDVDAHASDDPKVELEADDLAYIIYTSGSTGAPKGIMHSHHSGLAFSHWATREYGFTAQDRLSNHAPLHFDLSIMDYFSSMIAGASVVIVPEDYTKLPASYAQLIAERRVTVLYTVPFALIQLLLRGALEQRDLSHLRYAIFGGEPFPTSHLRALMKALPHVRFDNIYGPAEVNGVSHFTIDRLETDTEQIPIGPIAEHAHALIVDEHDEPVPDAQVGELLVSTPSMMQGYWRQPELSAKAQFRAGDRRYYRTGDLVERSADGLLRFVGRKDRQVKVRGYRVELDEIELALTALDEVEEGAAYVLERLDGSREIHAEITLKTTPDETSSLNRRLRQSLPWYAVPASLSIRTEFPRGVTGKIDRKELKKRAQMALDRSSDTP